MNTTKSQTKGIILMLTCAAMWSIAGIIFKFINWCGSPVYNGLAVAGARSLIAAVTAMICLPLMKMKFVFTKHSLLGGVLAACTFLCFVISNQLTTAANAIVLQYTGPIFIIIESYIFLHKKSTKLDIITSAAVFFGIALFVFDSLSAGGLWGNIISLGSGLFFGSMFFVVGQYGDDTRMSAIIIGHLITALVGLPFLACANRGITPASIGWIFVLGVFQLGIPYVLYALAAGHCSALTLSLTSVAEPLLNPVWVCIFYKEMPTLTALVGGIIVLTSVTLRSVLIARRG